MKWLELSILTTNEAIEPITNILHEAGVGGITTEDPLDMVRAHESEFGEVYELNPSDYPEEGVRLKTYLSVNDSVEDTIESIKMKITALREVNIDIGKNKYKVQEVHEEDWATAWKKYYKPVKISERITIKPTWEEYTPESQGELIIELDPGMAFGTGTHPTTMLSIQALDKYIQKGDTVLDVGTGSGVLSIVAARLGANHVYAYDLDDVAVKMSRINIEENKLSAKITTSQNDLLKNVNKNAQLIVANILAEIIVKFIGDAWKNLQDDGLFITSGIIENKKELVLSGLKDRGFDILEVNELEEWISIVAIKPSQKL